MRIQNRRHTAVGVGYLRPIVHEPVDRPLCKDGTMAHHWEIPIGNRENMGILKDYTLPARCTRCKQVQRFKAVSADLLNPKGVLY